MGKIERTLKRLRIVYYILLIVIGISIYQTLGPALRSASLKSEQSRDMLDVDNLSLREPGKELFVSSDSAIQIRLSGFQANIRKGTEVLRPWELIVMGAARIVGVLGFLIFLLIFVYSLYTITRSIFRKDIFNKRTIITCKLLALFWLITFLGVKTSVYFEKLAASRALDTIGWPVDVHYYFSGSVVTAIIIYIFAEVLSVGYELKKEQDLTV